MKDRAEDVWDRLLATKVQRFQEELSWSVDSLRELQLGSPIESMFLSAFILVRGWGEWVRVYGAEHDPDDEDNYIAEFGAGEDSHVSSRYDVRPQWHIDKYRVDFLIEHVSPSFHADGGGYRRGVDARLVVECDGHDFHERTKEQARRDRSRDRAIQQRGLMVLRYTGSEIHADANACGLEVCRALCRMAHDDGRELPTRRSVSARR